MCADPREVGECTLPPSESVPGDREETKGSGGRGNGGVG